MEKIINISPGELPIFLMVFFRVTGVLLLAPVFGSQMPSPALKIFLSLALAVLFFPLVDRTGIAVPPDFILQVLAVTWEFAVGILIGFAAAMIFAAVQLGGHLIDRELGLLQANVMDPLFNEQIAIVGQFKLLLATAVWLLINGHHFLLSAVSDSFRTVPLQGAHFAEGVALHLSDTMMRDFFRMGVEIAAPTLVTLFLITIALAFMARTAPEMNLFSLGFSLRVMVGLLVLAVGVGFFVDGFEERHLRHAGALRKLVGLLGG
jgi:flagellar biosynthetic protein FliR